MSTRKKNLNESKYPLIYLEWSDALINDEGWLEENKMITWGKEIDFLIHQCGFLISETKEYILLASRLHPNLNGLMMDGGIKIPKTWIKRKINLSKFISS